MCSHEVQVAGVPNDQVYSLPTSTLMGNCIPLCMHDAGKHKVVLKVKRALSFHAAMMVVYIHLSMLVIVRESA